MTTVLALVAVGNDGQLWLTSRTASTWDPGFQPIASLSFGGPGDFSDVACTTIDGQSLDVVGATHAQGLCYTRRRANRSWQLEFQLFPATGGPPGFSAVGCVGMGGRVHVVA